MGKWKQKNIEDLPIQIGDGNYSSKYPTAKDFLDSGVPFISNRDIKKGRILSSSLRYISTKQHNSLKKGHLITNDVLMSTRANIGDIAYVDDEYNNSNINAQLVFLRTDEKELNSKFLYFLLSSKKYKKLLENFASGSAQMQLPIASLKKVPIEYPLYIEQKAIAEVLGSLDDKIDLLHRQNKTLEELAQTLFRQWFIEKPNKEWIGGTLSFFANNPRKSIKPSEIEVGTKYIGLEHIERKNISLVKSGDSSTIASNKYQFEENDILFGKLRPYFHKVCFTSYDGICSTDILVIRPKKESYFAYILFAFNQEGVINYANSGSEGTRMPRTNWNVLSQYPVQIPSEHVLEEFNFIIMPSIEKIKTNQTQIKTLENIRDTLLPKLMSAEAIVK